MTELSLASKILWQDALWDVVGKLGKVDRVHLKINIKVP